MPAQPVIRVGLIGLSAKATGTGWAEKAHLPYLLNSPKYQIVALQNTSVERAQAAIKLFKLPESTKAYGTAEDLASDPDVDLVVSSVRVDSHASTLIPSIKAGKSVFLEWPLEANLGLAEELSALVKNNNVKSVVGLQARFSPIIVKLRELVRGGEIGRVLSSVYTSQALGFGPTRPKVLEYTSDREVGGNMVTIYGGHSIEAILSVLGELESQHTLLGSQYPTIDILKPDGTIAIKSQPQTSHDLLSLHGRLQNGASLTFHLRGVGRGATFPSTPNLDWRIFGSTGDIRVTHDESILGGGVETTPIIELRKGEKVERIEVKVDELEGVGEMPLIARNIGAVYEAFAEGEGYADFEHAVRRHRLIEEMYRQNGL